MDTRPHRASRKTSRGNSGGTFRESPIIVWMLAPVVLLFIVLTPFRQGEWPAETVILVAVVDALGILLLLALYKPKRFHWAGRAATGLVFLAYAAYLIDEIASGGSWHLGPRSAPSSLNALLGLFVIGVPCLRYTLLGRFGRKTEILSGDMETHRWLTGQCSQMSEAFA